MRIIIPSGMNILRTASLLLLLLFVSQSTFGDILSADRLIDWRNSVGIPGGIPIRQTVFTTVSVDTTGVADSTSAINAAIAACPSNQVIKLPSGFIRADGQINIKEGVTLRGNGMSNTILRTKSGVLSSLSFFSPSDFTVDQAITSGYTKGSTSLTLANASSFQVGHQLMVDEDNDLTIVNANGGEGGPGQNTGDPVYDRARGAYLEVIAKNGNTLTVFPALPWTFTAPQNPRAHIEATGNKTSIRWAGVESLTLTNTMPDGFAVEKMVSMWRASYCWLKDVETRRSGPIALAIRKGFRNQIEGCTFWGIGANSAGSGQGYCVQSDYKTSFNLIWNNISTRLLGLCTLEYGSVGNVIAFNFVTNAIYGFDLAHTQDTWMGADYSTHALHQGYELFEGNVGDMWSPDNIHGSSSHLIAFRNYFRGIRPGTTDHNRCVEIDAWQRYSSIVGNVLGNSSWTQSNRYEAINGSVNFGSDRTIYRIGYFNVNSSSQNYDTTTLSTLIRHGNWDAVTSTIKWESGIADRNLPSSLFLSARPSWWGASYPFPAIGSDLTPMVSMNPAQRRFLGIPEGGGTPPTEFNIVVGSSNPTSGVMITCTPADNLGHGSGTTSFTRTYLDGAQFTLTAPATASGKTFSKWTKNGIDYSASAAVTLTANADFTMTAVYVDTPPRSSGPIKAFGVTFKRS